MQLKKKAALTSSTLTTMITSLILIVLLFKVGAEMIPEAQSAGDELCSSGVPLAGFFEANGIVFMLIAAALVLTVIYAFLPKGKK